MSTINRRNWLKSTALLTGGATIPAWLTPAGATPPKTAPHKLISVEEAIAIQAPPALKARLFANENPFGPSELARKAIVDGLTNCYQYPFMNMRTLGEKIMAHHGIAPESLMLGAGSSQLLAAAAIHFTRKNGGNIISADPTYDDLPESAERFGAKWIKVPLTAKHTHDLDEMEKRVDSNTALVYICNPNNPTGTVLDIEKLLGFCERVSKKVPVFIDEAYIDYLPNPEAASMMQGIKKGWNILVARTFSKLYGFAGLRIGYLATQPDLVKQLGYYSSVNTICATSIQAASVAFQEKEFLADALRKTNASKDFLYKTLKEEGYEYIPSSTNFVMFPLKMDGTKFRDEMMKRGVGIRNWKYLDKPWCRVSIGRMDEMESFAAAFKELS